MGLNVVVNNHQPLVTVLMTAYNRQEYIAEAIESVLASTYTDFELIVLDDCSEDNTVFIAQKYEAMDSRVKVHVNDENLTQFKNRNKAAELARGKYIKYFDSDDVMFKDLLQITIKAMLSFPDAGSGVECTWEMIPPSELPVKFTSREAYVNHFFKGNDFLFFGPGSSIFKKSAFEECGGFNVEVGILADTLLMLQLAAKYPVVGYQPNLFYWRRHDTQVTVGQNDFYEMFCQRHQINSRILNSPIPLSEKEVKILKQNYKNIFTRSIFKHLRMVKSLSKIYEMIKLMDIGKSDIFKALLKNKSIGY
jgi:glycosyltransferase involved in cell wall biosynthesis